MDLLDIRVREILGPAGLAGPILEGFFNNGQAGDVAASLTSEVAGSAGTVMGHAVLVVVLLFFLLASGDRFWGGVSHLCSAWMDRGEFMQLIQKAEKGLSTYFFTVAVINTGVSILVGLVMFVLGMPTPFLWGALAGLLNFVPYLGAMTGEVIVAIVALVTFDSVGYAFLAPALYFAIAAVEGNFVTPMILGKKFTFRPVVVILSMIFWGWLWGTAGLLLAFPMLMLFGILSDNISSLSAIGRFLRPEEEQPKANSLSENALLT